MDIARPRFSSVLFAPQQAFMSMRSRLGWAGAHCTTRLSFDSHADVDKLTESLIHVYGLQTLEQNTYLVCAVSSATFCDSARFLTSARTPKAYPRGDTLFRLPDNPD